MPGKLGSGTVDDKTLRDLRGLFREALMRPPPGFLHYGDPFGDLQLRREIVDYLRATRGIRAEVDQVMVTSGTQSALSLIARAKSGAIDKPIFRRELAKVHVEVDLGTPVVVMR